LKQLGKATGKKKKKPRGLGTFVTYLRQQNKEPDVHFTGVYTWV